MAIHGYAAHAARESLRPFQYEPGHLEPLEIQVAVSHCGVCHSDLHLLDDDWRVSQFPLIAGHEIVGTVSAVGSSVTGLELGRRVGIGWQCASCMACEWCVQGEEACCPTQTATCVGRHGGFADHVHVDSRFAYPLPDALPSEAAAPLLCAGHTVFTPLRRHLRPGDTVGVIGIGGLGHLAIQFARAMGAHVIAFSTTPHKELEAHRFGAHDFVLASHPDELKRAKHACDLLLATAPAQIDWAAYMDVVRYKGSLIVVGVPPGDVSVPVTSLIDGDRAIRGSATGSRTTMREMLAFAARHHIRPKTELMPMSQVNEALTRVRENKARYRIVLEN